MSNIPKELSDLWSSRDAAIHGGKDAVIPVVDISSYDTDPPVLDSLDEESLPEPHPAVPTQNPQCAAPKILGQPAMLPKHRLFGKCAIGPETISISNYVPEFQRIPTARKN